MKPIRAELRCAVQKNWIALRFAAARASLLVHAGADPPRLPSAASSNSGSLQVNCVVFSKNRAMQLEACLRSIERFAPYSGPVIVVYKATSPEFREGYRLLVTGERVRLAPQSDDFRRDVLEAVDAGFEYTVFHTDDDVFFRRPPAQPIMDSRFAAFSLRLGENTTHCYPLSSEQPLPRRSERDAFFAWNWTRASHDFAYPISLDGHILATAVLRRMLACARFDNPNELESELHLRRHLAPSGMLSFRESCLVSIPANIVTPTYRNRAGENPDWSAEALNRRFLAGERIDVDAMDFSSIRGAHQEVPLAFAHIESRA